MIVPVNMQSKIISLLNKTHAGMVKMKEGIGKVLSLVTKLV